MDMVRTSPRRAEIERRMEAQETEWQQLQRKVFSRIWYAIRHFQVKCVRRSRKPTPRLSHQDQVDIENLVAANSDRLDLDWIKSEWQNLAGLDDPRMRRLLELVNVSRPTS